MEIFWGLVIRPTLMGARKALTIYDQWPGAGWLTLCRGILDLSHNLVYSAYMRCQSVKHQLEIADLLCVSGCIAAVEIQAIPHVYTCMYRHMSCSSMLCTNV